MQLYRKKSSRNISLDAFIFKQSDVTINMLWFL